MQSLKEQEDGPHLDLKNDLIVHLGQRVTMISDYQLPITPSSERLLYAIETTDEEAVAKAIEKIMKSEGAKRHEADGRVIWWKWSRRPTWNCPRLISAICRRLPRKMPKRMRAKKRKSVWLLPHAAVTVTNGHLFVASHIDFLRKVLKPVEDEDTGAEHRLPAWSTR